MIWIGGYPPAHQQWNFSRFIGVPSIEMNIFYIISLASWVGDTPKIWNFMTPSPHQDRHLREVCRVAAWCHAGAVPYSSWAVGWSDVWSPLSSLEVVSTSKEMRFVKII